MGSRHRRRHQIFIVVGPAVFLGLTTLHSAHCRFITTSPQRLMARAAFLIPSLPRAFGQKDSLSFLPIFPAPTPTSRPFEAYCDAAAGRNADD
jgi:cyanate permease